MKTHPQDRLLVAWTLCACVLLGLFACGLHHGQMTGLSLSGLNGGFCSLSGQGGGVDVDDLGHSEQVAQFSCPLCSSFAPAILSGSHAGWQGLLPGQAVVPIVVRSWGQPPPRYLWPALNPRASPLDLHV